MHNGWGNIFHRIFHGEKLIAQLNLMLHTLIEMCCVFIAIKCNHVTELCWENSIWTFFFVRFFCLFLKLKSVLYGISGISPISSLLVGELFPLEYRGIGSAIATTFSYFCAFISVKTFIDFQVCAHRTCSKNKSLIKTRASWAGFRREGKKI